MNELNMLLNSTKHGFIGNAELSELTNKLSSHMKNKLFFNPTPFKVQHNVLVYESFTTKNLRQSFFDKCTIDGADFTKAGLSGSVFVDCMFKPSSFWDTNLQACDFRSCTFENIEFKYTRMNKSVFYNVVFSKCVFISVSICDAIFESCIFDRCQWTPISVENTVFRNTSLDSVKMHSMNLEFATFDNICIKNVELETAMRVLVKTPLKIYQKSIFEQFDDTEDPIFNDNLALYRLVCVDDYAPYGRARVFHTPYTLRSKVSTSRYSIAGYPSLYLGTSLQLCAEEINYNPHRSLALASRYKIERCIEYNNTEIDVIELAVKPQDFLGIERNRESNQKIQRIISETLLNNPSVRNAYLVWYPIIAACSYIRTNKKDPFAAEYIVPQLLMQWVRREIQYSDNPEYDRLIGIRYFSCASKRASDMGFNYVFPASGKQHSGQYPYCPVLMKAFRLTSPKYVHESGRVEDCGMELLFENEFGPING